MKKISTTFMTFLGVIFILLGVLVTPVYADEANENRVKEQADAIAQEFQGREFNDETFTIMRGDIEINLVKKGNSFTFEVKNTSEDSIVSYPVIIEKNKLNIDINQTDIKFNSVDVKGIVIGIAICVILIIMVLIFIKVTRF